MDMLDTRYASVARLNDSQFRRLTGVSRSVFTLMVDVYEREDEKRKKVSGRPAKLSRATHVLMMLEYNREYRTYFHIAESYGVSESYAYKIIKRVEELLIRSGSFSLPKKSSLYTGTPMTVIIDVTESPVERPKKNRGSGIPASKSTTISRVKW